ncbi:asparagine--tRNA ligase [Candidatus Bathyarchaeota archaeon]|nr:asparagine--tRNA ligase [Candidatus Bathyarchaeota archaeon]
MTEFVDIAKIIDGKKDDEQVNVRGWLWNSRSSGGILFLMLRDGTGVLQCTVNKRNVDEETYNALEKLTQESAIELSGVIKVDQRAPNGYELAVSNFGKVHLAQPDFPIAKKEHGLEFLMDNRHLWIRDPKLMNIFRIRSKFMEAARKYFWENDYTEIQSPSFQTGACEGGSTLFEVKYFERKGVYLSQSWQLYAEAMISSVGKIFTLAPSFRAEPSRTRRHLSEFWHLECEEPWSTLDDINKTGDKLVCYIAHTLANEMPREVKATGRDIKDLLILEAPFPKISYDEAVEIVQKSGVEMNWGDDFGWQQEEPLTKEFDVPFWVRGFPTGIKPFYHMPDPVRPEVTLSSDLLAPEGYGEIIGGGQRVHDYDQLIQRIIDDGFNPEDYQWYTDLRRWGTVPHSGFGLGVERVLCWMLKLEHIRDAIPFPRDMRRVYP